MLENQFIAIISPYYELRFEPAVLPKGLYDGSIYSPLEIYIAGGATQIALLYSDGSLVPNSSITLTESASEYKIYNLRELFYNVFQLLDVGVPYFIRIKVSNNNRYSRPVIFTDKGGLSYVRYRCNEPAFGFPFGANEYVSMFLPVNLHSPQNVQEDKTYVKSNGEVVTLYAKYYKEWEGETEYLSEDMHDKIVAALSCDEVYIKEKRVTKSDKYQVDWENYDLDCNGVTKLAKATFKVRENITQRNSNF